MHKDKRLTIVVNSCDAYADLWDIFFDILARRWRDIPYDIVLNTESADYTGGRLPVRCLHPAIRDRQWTGRLREILGQLDSELVLLLMDDFLLTGDVDGGRLARYIEWILASPDIATIHLWPMDDATPSARYPGLGLRPKDGPYLMSAFAGIWRRERLMDFLAVDENAWEWEYAGTLRYAGAPDSFYALLKDTPLPIPFDNYRYGIIGGRWTPETPALLAGYGHKPDFSRRGFFRPELKALLPQTAAAFRLDSALYLDRGRGYSERDALFVPNIVRDGYFRQVFSLDGNAGGVARWDPSAILGFSLSELSVTVGLRGDLRRRIPLWALGGNHVTVGHRLVFLREDPQLLAALPRGASEIIFEGTAACPIDDTLFRRALGRRPLHPGFALFKLMRAFGAW